MKKIASSEITKAIKSLCYQANCELNEDVVGALERAKQNEKSDLGAAVIEKLLENVAIAKTQKIALCQDTGMVVIFLEIGQDVRIVGGGLEDAVNEGVRQSYRDFYYRQSIVQDPLIRENTGDNTPAIIHTRIVTGDKLRITVAPKGFGSENMSVLKMLNPTDGLEGIKRLVIETVSNAGGNPCPPIIVGIGIGGTMEKAAVIAKKALLRKVNSCHPKKHIAELEVDLLQAINDLGIGPQGFGGTTTALAVNIETYPTHIAGLPVAININCHVARHRETVI